MKLRSKVRVYSFSDLEFIFEKFPVYLFYISYGILVVPCLFCVKMHAAAVAWEAGKPLSIETIEVAPPQKGEVRLRILFNSLCRSDVYWWDAKVY